VKKALNLFTSKLCFVLIVLFGFYEARRIIGNCQGMDIALESNAFVLVMTQFCRSFLKGDNLIRWANRHMEDWKEVQVVKDVCALPSVKINKIDGVGVRKQ